MSSLAVNRPKIPVTLQSESTFREALYAPRKAVKIIEGTIPTTAIADGSESIPLLTISAIMNKATN